MKNIKDITISIFAIIGFVAILSSFNNQSEPQETHGTPESHVWELHPSPRAGAAGFALNRKTGEVRKLNTNGYDSKSEQHKYKVMSE